MVKHLNSYSVQLLAILIIMYLRQHSSVEAVSPEFGYVYLTLYLVITNITLLNFLIAILSDIYTFLQEKSTNLYLKQIVKVKQYLDDDKYYSSLVAAVVPFNFLIIPFAPFIILCKSEKLNKVLMYYCYLPALFVGSVGFIFRSLLVLPISYLCLISTQTKNMFNVFRNKKFRGAVKRRQKYCSKERCRKISSESSVLAFIVILGLPYLLFLTVVDT